MKVLMLNYEFPPLGGGASSLGYEHARELVRSGHEVDVVTMGYVSLPRFEVLDGIHVYRVRCLRSRKDVVRMHELASYIASALPLVIKLVGSRKYDINHTHFVVPTGIISLILKRLTGLRYVITAHGSDVPGYNSDRFEVAHKLIRPFWRSVVSGAAFVVAPTEYLKALILDHQPRANIRIIPHGFDYGRFRWDYPKDRKVLVVSRMLRRKGVQYLLEALHGIELNGYRVDIVGEGPYLSQLKDMAVDLPRKVHFWGWMDNRSAELRDQYERSSIFVFLSESENFPIVLLEAMASGQAIITVNGSGFPEVVGDQALLVPPRDPEAVRTALCRLMQDPELRDRLGAGARARVQEQFSWEKVVGQYTDVYEGVAGS